MPVYRQRGLDREQEQISSLLIRDTRTVGQKLADFLKNKMNTALVLFSLACGCLLIPHIVDILLIVGISIFIYANMQEECLPFRLPLRSKMKDYNTPKPGTNKPSKAAGIYYFGNEIKSGGELWFTNEDMRTHVLMFGSTGSGKTESLVSLAYNALIQSSGFIYVDGKGDNSLFAKVFSLVRSMGREDDMLLINFMTGARDIIGPQEKRLSNTMNPFARGSSSMLSQLVVSLMESGKGGGGDQDMWKGRAISFVESIMKVLVYMRDAGHILIDANVIRNYFSLERLESIVMDRVFPRDNQEPVNLEGTPEIIIEPIANYLINLPGYNKEKKGQQVSQVYEQHGYITMQLTRVFSSLADTYGHIIRTDLPEVDLRDVVLNRRILVVLLPALEKSPAELSNLGKVIIASLKTMMAAGLGDEVEGMYNKVIERKPTNAKTPFLCILDEYGYYAVEGFAVVPAQARSLGFSVIFAGQDLPALQKASKEEAATIGANTNIKVCMKLEDPVETWEFFMKGAGESYVTHVGGFQTSTSSVSGQYMDTKSANLEKRQRIDLQDLKEQRGGEAHIFFKSRIIRARMFYANPKPVKEIRLNHFVKVDVPTDATLRGVATAIETFKNLLDKKDNLFSDVFVDEDDDVAHFIKLYNNSKSMSLIERCIEALLKYGKRDEEDEETELDDEDDNSTRGFGGYNPFDDDSNELPFSPRREQHALEKLDNVDIDDDIDIDDDDDFSDMKLNIDNIDGININLDDEGAEEDVIDKDSSDSSDRDGYKFELDINDIDIDKRHNDYSFETGKEIEQIEATKQKISLSEERNQFISKIESEMPALNLDIKTNKSNIVGYADVPKVDIFSGVGESLIRQYILSQHVDKLCDDLVKPMLNKEIINKVAIDIEKYMGKSKKSSTKLGNEVIKDIISITTYPPPDEFKFEQDNLKLLSQLVKDVLEKA